MINLTPQRPGRREQYGCTYSAEKALAKCLDRSVDGFTASLIVVPTGTIWHLFALHELGKVRQT